MAPRLLRWATLCVALGALGGCATSNVHAGNFVSNRPAAVPVSAGADWSWNVAGDAAVRPVQVFALNGKTYLQMRPGQRLPAIFVDGSPVPFVLSAPYLIVQGVPSKMNLVANGYRALVIHRGPVTVPKQPRVVGPSRVQRIPDGGAAATTQPSPTVEQFKDANTPVPARHVPHAAIDIRPAIEAHKHAAAARRVWRITPSQKMLSDALAAWAKSAGLTLVWKSSVDLPIRRAAEYRAGGFLSAVSALLADASAGRYRFFYSVTGTTFTVISVRQS